MRNDYRQFRADRIQGITKTELSFSKEHLPLETYLKKQNECPTTRVIILVDKKISKYLANEKKYHGFISQKTIGEKIEMTFLCRDIEEGFSRWLLMFADYATIVEPQRLKDRTMELLENYKTHLLK